MRTTILVAGLAWAGCADLPGRDAGADDPFCSTNLWFADADGDGFGTATRTETSCPPPGARWSRTQGDCDDAAPDVNPGAREQPNGVDDDCDGVIDEGTPRADDDGDGWCGVGVASCASALARPGDCDDRDPTRHPEAPERCNGLDDDCDGRPGADEVDLDGDGHLFCVDCADADPTVHPGAAERCDGVDRDCDGLIGDVDGDGDGVSACPGVPAALDLLVVVDAGPGAPALQAQAAAAVPAWLAGLRAGGVDLRVAVVAASTGSVRGGPWGLDTPELATRLVEAIRVGGGGGAGPDLDGVGGALDPLDLDRPGARRATLVIAGSDDTGARALDVVARDLGADGRIDVLAGGWRGCPGRAATPRLAALAERSGGQAIAACTSDWVALLLDGWRADAAQDCDDRDPYVHPGGAERCNGVDDDCDGAVDEDGDGDAWTVCAGDCDDRSPQVHPGAPERCNGVDDDCDGVVPVGERDVDADGLAACAGDCDDTDPTIRPGRVDGCGDGVDRDCSGDDGAGADRLDLDGDGFSACDGDCGDDDVTTFPGAPEHRFDGVDNDCDGLLDGADPDRVIPLDLRLGTISVGSTTPLLTVCGAAYSAFAVTGSGLVLLGEGRSGQGVAPSVDGLATLAPALASGWSALDPSAWVEGRFLHDYGAPVPAYAVVRDQGVTVVIDGVPYRDGDAVLTSVTTVQRNDVVQTLLEGDPSRDTLVGVACETQRQVTVDTSSGEACFRVDDTGTVAGFLDAPLPLWAATTCVR